MRQSFPTSLSLHMRTILSFVALVIIQATAWAVPNAPSSLTVTALNASSVELRWVDNSTDEADFFIRFRVPPTTSFSNVGWVEANSTSITLTGTQPETTYEFVLVARDAAQAESPLSNVASVTTPVRIASASYHGAHLNEFFSFNLVSSLPALVTGYAITALPPGLELNAATGLISGTPTAGGKVTGVVTITHTGGRIAYAPLSLRVFVPRPDLAAPVAGTPRGAVILQTAGPATTVSVAGLFTDPDVTTAARLTTDLGNLDFAFYPWSAPATVTNFLGYINRGDFANTIFHRSVPGFVIQGGAFRADATASAVTTQPPVVNEPNITNVRGTIAMAKLGGNPDSATNQFFVNLGNNNSISNANSLDNQNEGFTVFARVAGNGMSVADAIAALPLKNYSAVNGAMDTTPVRNNPAAYDPASLVRINQATVIDPIRLTVSSSNPLIASVTLNGTDLSVVPVSVGSVFIEVTATDLDGLTAQSTFPVTVNDAFLTWAQGQAFANSIDASPGADPDGDGQINLVEFVLNSSPLAGSSSGTSVVWGGGRFGLRFPLQNDLRGTTVTLQSSDSLSGSWIDRWSNADGFNHLWILSHVDQGSYSLITAQDPGASSGRGFLRLKVTRP